MSNNIYNDETICGCYVRDCSSDCRAIETKIQIDVNP